MLQVISSVFCYSLGQLFKFQGKKTHHFYVYPFFTIFRNLYIYIISILKPSIGINTYTFTLYTQNYELKCTVKYITTAQIIKIITFSKKKFFLSSHNIKMDPKNIKLYVMNKSYFIVDQYQKDTCFYDEDAY